MQVARRKVFYIPGYDPFHPRRYRELYRKEAAAQAAVSGHGLEVAGRAGDRYGWRVDAEVEGAAVETDIEVLVWSDIVKESMDAGIAGTYAQLVRTAWIYISTGALFRLMRLRKGPVIAALYPVVFLLIQGLLAVSSGIALWWFCAWLLGPWGHLPGLVLALAAGWAVLRWFRKRDNRLFAYYLMHDYAYSAQSKGRNPPPLEARMAAFGDHIAGALAADWDEVLVVGHSSGAHLGVSVLADLLRAGRVPGGAVLNFLTLGQVVPMVSFLPDAGRLRADLQFMSEQQAVAWIDVTAPGDGCAFALCDPVAVSGVARKGQVWPLVLSAAFTQTLSEEKQRELRGRFFRLHFQYLCAFDRPGDYDYFAITAGPRTLRDRFDGRAPSPSALRVAANRYTSVAA